MSARTSHEDRHSPANYEGIGRRDKCVRGHYHFVARPNAGENGRHFERRCARLSQQRLPAAQALTQPGVATLGKIAVPAEVSALEHRGEVLDLLVRSGTEG